MNDITVNLTYLPCSNTVAKIGVKQTSQFNISPNDVLEVTKLKTFADDKLNVTEMTISPLDKAEKSAGKGKCWLPVYPPFPTAFCKTGISSFYNRCFAKPSSLESSKSGLF